MKQNNYNNVVELKRKFITEDDGYDENDDLIQNILSKTIFWNAELFFIELDMVI